MFAIFATIRIKPGFRERYLAEMLGDAVGSVRDEPGCLRFDVLADQTDPDTLYLYEIYRDEAAFAEHVKAPHYIKWRDAVQGWAEVSAVRATTIFPPDHAWQPQALADPA